MNRRAKGRRAWSHGELAALRAVYPDHRAEDIARAMQRPVSAVYRKAAQLGLSKSEAFNASDHSGRIQRGRTDPRMLATQFKAGLVPWNKGRHYVAGGRSAETRFKPGRRPEESANYLPIGSLRLSKDGYLERKVTDDPSLVPARRWTAEHRLVWERDVGPIPAGHVVVFREGCRTNVLEKICAAGLECIPRSELARRNHPRSKSPELAKLVQLKGAITRQVNRIVRESRDAEGTTTTVGLANRVR